MDFLTGLLQNDIVVLDNLKQVFENPQQGF